MAEESKEGLVSFVKGLFSGHESRTDSKISDYLAEDQKSSTPLTQQEVEIVETMKLDLSDPADQATLQRMVDAQAIKVVPNRAETLQRPITAGDPRRMVETTSYLPKKTPKRNP